MMPMQKESKNLMWGIVQWALYTGLVGTVANSIEPSWKAKKLFDLINTLLVNSCNRSSKQSPMRSCARGGKNNRKRKLAGVAGLIHRYEDWLEMGSQSIDKQQTMDSPRITKIAVSNGCRRLADDSGFTQGLV